MKLIKYLFISLLFFSKASLAFMTLTGTDSITLDQYESYINMHDSSSISLQATSSVAFLDAYNNSSVNVFGGTISWISAYDNVKTNISGGDISWLQLYDNSITNIYSLNDLSWLLVSDNSVVNIYGSGFYYHGGHLDVSWENGSFSSFWALKEDDLSSANIGNILPKNIVLHKVPEPLSISLILIGIVGIFIRRKYSH